MKKVASVVGVIAGMAFCSSYTPAIETQEFTYEVKIGHKNLGELKVSKQEMGSREDYEFNQITEDGLLHRSTVQYSMHSQYENEKLVSMELRNIVDDVLLQSTDMELVDGVYELHTDLGNMTIPESELRPGSAKMFFGEPEGLSSVFHEKYGSNVNLIKKAENIYELQLPNGGREVYTYKDGKVFFVMIDRTFATFTLTIKNPE